MGLNFGQNLFPPRGEMIASYDSVDILTGQGYLIYYLATGNDSSAAEQKILIPNVVESLSKSTTHTHSTADNTWTKVGDDDYDLDIKLGARLTGTATAQLTWSFNFYNEDEGYIVVKLRKYDGTTETEIASGKTDTMIADTNHRKELLLLEMTGETRINKGDILRITVETWHKCSTAGGGHQADITYWHDPKSINRWAVNYNKPAAEGELFEYGITSDFITIIPLRVEI